MKYTVNIKGILTEHNNKVYYWVEIHYNKKITRVPTSKKMCI